MNSKRTSVLQILTEKGWEYIFCWSVNGGKIATTEDYRKAVRAEAGNVSYFQERAGNNQIRSCTAAGLENQASR